VDETAFAYVNPKSAERVLDILEFVAGTREGHTRSQIAASLGIPKSSASALLRSLVMRGYLHETADGRRLTIGVRAFETGSGFLRQVSLREIARPLMDELVAEFAHTCHLAVLDDRDVVYLDKVDPPRSAVQLVTSIGTRLPAANTAVGRAQLAFVDDSELEARFSQPTRDDVALDKLRGVRDEVRARGWASEHGETTPGIGCVAAPIFDYSGRPIGAIGATYLEATALGFELEAGPRLRVAGLEISRLGGFRAGSNGDGTLVA
jgi:IclR family transcriptional regulator, KDG regulon repressor